MSFPLSVSSAAAVALLLAGCGGGHTATSHTTHTTISRPHGPVGGGETSPNPGKHPKALNAGYRVILRPQGSAGRRSRVALTASLRLLGATHQVCWQFGRLPRVVVQNGAFGQVHAVLTPNATSINSGSVRATRGPVLVSLGVSYAPRGCTAAAASVLNAIVSAPADYYVEVVNGRYPGGRLRAQL